MLKSRERAPLLLQVELLAQPLPGAAIGRGDPSTRGRPDRPTDLQHLDLLLDPEVRPPPPSPAKAPARPPQPAAGGADFTNGFGVVFRSCDSPEPPSSPLASEGPIELLPESPTAALATAVSTMYPQSPSYTADGMGRVFEGEAEVAARLASGSPYSSLPGWEIGSLIVKSGDDIRQEQLAAGLIGQFAEIFAEAELALWLRPYRVIAVSPNSGLIELIPSVLSVHALKASTGKSS